MLQFAFGSSASDSGFTPSSPGDVSASSLSPLSSSGLDWQLLSTELHTATVKALPAEPELAFVTALQCLRSIDIELQSFEQFSLASSDSSFKAGHQAEQSIAASATAVGLDSAKLRSSSALSTSLPSPSRSGLLKAAQRVRMASGGLKFKTELCRSFQDSGCCEYAEHCQFAHGRQELRNRPDRHRLFKTEQCRAFHGEGVCRYGSRCHFIH